MRRPFYRHPGMPLQRWIADPARGDGAAADGTPGDCYRTALAGALGLHRDAVPHFVSYSWPEAAWWWEVQRWATAQWGRSVYTWTPDVWREHRGQGTAPLYPGERPFLVASGPSPRGTFHHSIVVDLDLNPVHDPHPLGMGLVEIQTLDIMLAVEWMPPPRKALPRHAARVPVA